MNRNDSPWANPALALALLRPRNAAPKPQQLPPCDTPSCQQAANKERATEKGKSPRTPLKEKDSEKEILPSPPPSPSITPARAPAQGEPVRTGTGSVGFRQDLRAGTARAAASCRIDREFIMDESRDAVQIALVALNIPKITAVNGRTYNNPRLMRWLIPQVGGEDAFRELVYEQWRENMIDGRPRSCAAAFMAKLYAVRDAMRGGAA